MIVVFLLAACSSLSPASAPTGPNAAAPGEPTLGLTLAQAQQTAGDFLNAWSSADYAAMYRLLHVKSQGVTAQADFVALYTSIANKLTLQPHGVSYVFSNAIQQGSQVQISYDATFKTQIFSTFSDPNRVISMESTADGWRVIWTLGDIFAEMGSGATLDLATVTPNRGNIYGRDGTVLADQGGVQITLTLLTEKYPGDPMACFNQLARVFPARNATILQKVYGPYTGKSQAYIVGQLSAARFTTEKPALEKACTLQYQSQPAREYPNGGFAPHVVGYVGHIPVDQQAEWLAKGYSPDALIGLDGVENAYESTLSGRGATTLVLRSGGQVVRKLAQDPGVLPQSVYLTLDSKLQQAVQDALREAYQSSSAYFYTSNGGAVVVMDVHTGEILAMASYPDFDENALTPISPLPNASELATKLLTDPRKPTLNRATLGSYPLGSVFKIVSMAAAADSGQFNLNTLFTCTGLWSGRSIGDRTRTDWIYGQGIGQHGTITLEQALTGSCDIYFWHVGWTLNGVDPTLIPKYAKQMGFGAPTGVVGVSETAGNVPDPTHYAQTQGRDWTGSDALDLSIGQGNLLVTPLQVVRMIAGIANGGTLFQPQVVKQIGLINQPSYVAKPIINGNMNVKPEVLAGIRAAMCNVTTDPSLGTATFVFRGFDFSKVTVCGKTGTAESGQLNPHAWFAAFAGKSAANPDIAIVTVIENSYEGSYVSAPIVRRIVESYYGLPISPWPAWYGSTPETVSHGGD
jgi:penicillin-binding protein 2